MVLAPMIKTLMAVIQLIPNDSTPDLALGTYTSPLSGVFLQHPKSTDVSAKAMNRLRSYQ